MSRWAPAWAFWFAAFQGPGLSRTLSMPRRPFQLKRLAGPPSLTFIWGDGSSKASGFEAEAWGNLAEPLAAVC